LQENKEEKVDDEVVEKSEELDKLLNKYQELFKDKN